MPQTWVPQDGLTRRVIAVIVTALMVFTLVAVVSATNPARATHADHADPPTTGLNLPNAGTLDKDPLCTLAYGENGKSNWTGDPYGHEPGHPGGLLWTGEYAIWANATSYPDKTSLDISGNSNWIDGATVSRYDLKIGGANNVFLHGTSYGNGTYDLAADDNCFVSGPVEDNTPTGFPVVFSIADFQPGSTAAQFAGAAGEYYVCGDFTTNGTTIKNSSFCDGDDLKISTSTVIPKGLYYVEGQVDISASNTLGIVTIVSETTLDASGSSGSDFFAYMRGLLFMADGGTPNTNTDEPHLKAGGSESTYNRGHLFAPNGRVELSGQRNFFNCTVMGDRVRLNGSNNVIAGELCDDGGPQNAELEVVKTGTPDSVPVGGAWVEFEVQLTNTSPDESLTITELTDWFDGAGEYDLLDPAMEGGAATIQNNKCDENLPIQLAKAGPGTDDEHTCTFETWVQNSSVSTTHAYDDNECTSGTAKIDVVTGTGVGDVSGATTNDQDCEEVTIDVPPDPEIEIAKSASPTQVYESGAFVTYTLTLTNESLVESVTMTTLEDDVDGNTYNLLTGHADLKNNTCLGPIVIPIDDSVQCSFDLWVSGSTTTATGSHTDCDPASEIVIDIVTGQAIGDTSTTSTNEADDCEEVEILPDPELTIEKTASPTTIFDGQTVTYTVRLINSSETENVVVDVLTDELVNGSPLDLLTFTPPSPILTNTCNTGAVSGGDSATITVPMGGVDNSVTCQFTVAVSTSTDSYEGTAGDACDTFDKVDVVTASGEGAESGVAVSDDDCAGVDIEPDPDFTIVKTADPTTVYSGQTVTYTVQLINHGADYAIIVDSLVDELEDGTPLDLLAPTPPAPILTNTCNATATITVPPGGIDEAVTCQFTLTMLHATPTYIGDGDDSCETFEKVDLVTASGEEDESGTEVSANDCAGVDILPDPELVIVKDAEATNYYEGEEIVYTVTFTNESQTEDIVVDSLTDDLGGGEIDLLAFGLAAGLVANDCNENAVDAGTPGTITVPAGTSDTTCSFSVEADLDMDTYTDDNCDESREYVDLVVASGAGEDSGIDVESEDCASIDIDPDPMLTLVKEVTSPADLTVEPGGEFVTYKVTIGNTSETESVEVTSLEDDVDGAIYDLLSQTPNAALVVNSCNDATLTIAPQGSVNCSFTIWVDHETTSAAGQHRLCTPDDQVIDIVTAQGVGLESKTLTNEADDCAEVTVDEPDASLAIDKLVWDEKSQTYLNSTFLASSVALPASVEWKITVSNPSDDRVINIVFTDTNAPACVTAFANAMDAIHTDKDWLDAGESVTFTCTDSVPSVGFTNTAVANGDDEWNRPVDEVDDDAFVLQIVASGSIGDTVWYDCAKTDTTDATCDNGVQDTGELGIEGVKVTLTGLDGQDLSGSGLQSSSSHTTMTLLTDANGHYLFTGLPDGNYKVQVLIGDVPDAQDRTLRFTTASSFTMLLPEGGERLDADFGVIADTLPETGINTDQIVLVSLLLLAAGALALLIARRKEEEHGTDMAA